MTAPLHEGCPLDGDARLLTEAMRHAMPEPVRPSRLNDWLAKIASAACLMLGVWLIGLREEVALLRAEKATHEEVIEAERRIKQDLPPEWLRADIAEIKASLAVLPALVERVRTLEERPPR